MIGSASVYDPRIPHALAREDEAPVAAARYLNEYGRSKAAQERLVARDAPMRSSFGHGPCGDQATRTCCRACSPGSAAAGCRSRRRAPPAVGDPCLDRSSRGRRRGGATEVAGPVNVADATPTSAAALLRAVLGALGGRIRIEAVPPR